MDTLASAAGLLVAILAILALVYRTLRTVYRIDKALPTLLSIADEFHANGGSTLKDDLVTIHADITEFSSALAKHSQEDEVRFARMEGILLSNSTVLSNIRN